LVEIQDQLDQYQLELDQLEQNQLESVLVKRNLD
jgi:hypothetical protein